MGRAHSQKRRAYLVRRCALPSPLSVETIDLPETAQHYLCQVLRLRDGDLFIGFDGQGNERVFRIHGREGQWSASAHGSIYQGKCGVPIALIFAVPKGDKLDQVARQLTELGISELHLFAADRSVGIWKENKVQTKLARVKRVIQEAARQSGRADSLNIFTPQKLSTLIDRHKDATLKIYFDPTAPHGWPSLDQQITPTNCVLIVGPEGGLSESEISTLQESGWIGVRLNTPILRTETAALVTCTLALDRLEYLT